MSKQFPYSGHQSPATISLSSRCYCGKLPGSHAASKLHLQPSSERGLTWGTHRGKTAQHSEMPRLPLFASLPSWMLGSGWLSCRDSASWFSADALSYHLVVCCWKDMKHNATQTRKVECAVFAPPPRSCDVPQARRDLLVVHWRAKVKGKLDVGAVDFAVSRHFAMNDLVMRGRDCDWKKEHRIFLIIQSVTFGWFAAVGEGSGLSFREVKRFIFYNGFGILLLRITHKYL